VQVKQVVENDIRSAEDLNTQIKVLESGDIVRIEIESLGAIEHAVTIRG
jgi:2-keto-4-pentenoate hydratase/2-oxohepta-3-ene-1,7-dioic acid hydratase in catechol pathway